MKNCLNEEGDNALESPLLTKLVSFKFLCVRRYFGGGEVGVVFLLVLIKGALTIKRMLSLRHPCTRDLFLHQGLKN